jgi:hypothetical protein
MPNKDLHVPLLELSKPSVVRVVSPCMLPAFTETLVEVRTDRSGVSVVRAPRHRRDVVFQVKNGLIDLPAAGKTFHCWLAKFSDQAISLSVGQVVGVSEAHILTHVCAVPVESSGTPLPDKWEEIVKSQGSSLSPVEMEKLLETLRPHSSIWDGHL